MAPRFRLTALIAVLLNTWLVPLAAQPVKTEGDCSPALVRSKVTGSITINCRAYSDELKAFAAQLNELQRTAAVNGDQLRGLIDGANIMVDAVLRGLDSISADVRESRSESRKAFEDLRALMLEQASRTGTQTGQAIVAEAEEWRKRYESQLEKWTVVEGTSMLDKQAREAFVRLDFERAGSLLDQIISQQEKMVKTAAARHYRRADVFRLQFKPAEALPHYERAYTYWPGNYDYAFAYGVALQDQRQFTDAERVYKRLLPGLRSLAQDKPAYRSNLALTLNNLAVILATTGRIVEAEEILSEVLPIYRALKKENPARFRPDVARTLHNLGASYSDSGLLTEAETAYRGAMDEYFEFTKDELVDHLPQVATTKNNLGIVLYKGKRFAEAETFYKAALSARRALAERNPAAYRGAVAATLRNLADLYIDSGRIGESELRYQEALEAYRALTKENPAKFLPDLATTLLNQGGMYADTRRFKEAESACNEALAIFRELARGNPAAYRPYLAAAWTNLGRLYRATGRFKEAEAAFEAAAR